ncbi:MAG: hypothetical protein IIC71_07755 [Acidobacteria bacterium]|nr:hypothetical protein [Acidobacteriota bacterium]
MFDRLFDQCQTSLAAMDLGLDSFPNAPNLDPLALLPFNVIVGAARFKPDGFQSLGADVDVVQDPGWQVL